MLKNLTSCWMLVFLVSIIVTPTIYAESINEINVYVWDFVANDNRKTDSLTRELTSILTEEFEEKLIQANCFNVVERRQLDRLIGHRRKEQKALSILQLSTSELKEVEVAKVNAVIFGEFFDDIRSGHCRIKITMEDLSGKKIDSRSINFPRGKIFDMESRELFMKELVQDFCPSVNEVERFSIQNLIIGENDSHYRIEVIAFNPLDRDVLVKHVKFSKESADFIVCSGAPIIHYALSDQITIRDIAHDGFKFTAPISLKNGVLSGYRYDAQGGFGSFCGDDSLEIMFDSSFFLKAQAHSTILLDLSKKFGVTQGIIGSEKLSVETLDVDLTPDNLEFYLKFDITIDLSTDIGTETFTKKFVSQYWN